MINRDFVAVWINVRTTPLPHLQAIKEVLVNAKLDADNRVIDPFSKGFFLRSAVFDAAGELLNPQPSSVGGSMGNLYLNGALSYAQVDPPDYLSMLMHAREKFVERAALR